MGEDPQAPGYRLSRRALLVTGATGVVDGVAGCTTEAGTDTETSAATATDSRPSSDGPSPEPTAEEAALTDPVQPTDDDRCAVCNMAPAKFPDWNAQLTLDVGGGRRAHFCSPGCLTAFAPAPDEFVDGAARAQLVGAWAHDHLSKRLVDATGAGWVLEVNADRIDAPMMANPLPFAERADALAYVDRYDDLTRHDVVGFEAFDVSLARRFRAKFLPDTEEPSVLEPATVPGDESCAVCEMMPAKFPGANAQVSFEDGARAFFCSPGCKTAFYADPGNFRADRRRDDVVGAWDHDYGSKEQIDALGANYVLETDASRIDLPMMENPVPFGSRADAVAYVDRYHDLSADDVIPLTAFTVDVAERYRGKFF